MVDSDEENDHVLYGTDRPTQRMYYGPYHTEPQYTPAFHPKTEETQPPAITYVAQLTIDAFKKDTAPPVSPDGTPITETRDEQSRRKIQAIRYETVTILTQATLLPHTFRRLGETQADTDFEPLNDDNDDDENDIIDL